MKKKKESIVVFEDWMKYARCLNDKEFRELISAIFEYYKTQEQPKFTGNQMEVWNDIIDDLQSNVSKKQAKRNTMLRNAKTNPKLNIVPNIGPDTGSNIEPNIEPKIVPNTSGMVDGRWDMVDDGMDDGLMDDEPMVDEPDVKWFLNRLEMGEQYHTLRSKYPQSSSLEEAYNEYFDKW